MFFVFKSKASMEAAVSRKAIETAEQIIEEMGAELHDDLIQRLSIYRLYHDRIEKARDDRAETELLITSMKADFQEVVESVRRISRRLMPVKMESDSLETRIRNLCQHMERPGGGTIHFHHKGTEQPVVERDALYLLRIVQELINNAQKHSAAWHVDVRLEWNAKTLSIEVEDDGTAFTKASSFISVLKSKTNTLKMRSVLLRTRIQYRQGASGLLARMDYSAT